VTSPTATPEGSRMALHDSYPLDGRGVAAAAVDVLSGPALLRFSSCTPSRAPRCSPRSCSRQPAGAARPTDQTPASHRTATAATRARPPTRASPSPTAALAPWRRLAWPRRRRRDGGRHRSARRRSCRRLLSRPGLPPRRATPRRPMHSRRCSVVRPEVAMRVRRRPALRNGRDLLRQQRRHEHLADLSAQSRVQPQPYVLPLELRPRDGPLV
jgi:hypothetical protein